MRILVVGSGGVGAAFAPIAARRDFYEHVVFADIDESRAAKYPFPEHPYNGAWPAIRRLDGTVIRP